jgi:hypothetical protein
VDEAGENHPARHAVATHSFRGLKEVFDLSEVGVGVGVVHEGVEEVGGFPDGLLAFL